jgi:hypothetical protein
MKEKKSSPYKSRKRLFDFLFTLLCLAGAAAGLWLFWADVNHVLNKSEQPIGVVTYKRRAVQRRFEDRLLWSQLPRESPVYNGDLVRTSDLSDATIRFASDDIIDLAENSLIHILYDEKTGVPRIELVGGEVNLRSESGRALIVLGDRELRPEAGGVLVVSGGEAETEGEIRAIAGSTEISSPEGSFALEAGMAASAALAGPLETSASFTVLSPAPVEELQAGSGLTPVHFSWTGGGRVTQGSPAGVRIEVATDRRFSNIVYSGDVFDAAEADVPLAPGVWWWRAFLGEDGSAAPVSGIRSGRLTVLEPPPPPYEVGDIRLSSPLVLASLSSEAPVSGVNLGSPPSRPVQAEPPVLAPLPRPSGLYPPDRTVIDGAALKKSPRVVFSWNRAEGANGYICTIRQGSFIDSRVVSDPYLVFEQLGALQNGECVWQVEAVLLFNDGSIQRRGEIAESRFTLFVPRPDTPIVNDPGIIYGK